MFIEAYRRVVCSVHWISKSQIPIIISCGSLSLRLLALLTILAFGALRGGLYRYLVWRSCTITRSLQIKYNRVNNNGYWYSGTKPSKTLDGFALVHRNCMKIWASCSELSILSVIPIAPTSYDVICGEEHDYTIFHADFVSSPQ